VKRTVMHRCADIHTVAIKYLDPRYYSSLEDLKEKEREFSWEGMRITVEERAFP
jgi:hypothetical protein